MSKYEVKIAVNKLGKFLGAPHHLRIKEETIILTEKKYFKLLGLWNFLKEEK